MKGREYRGYVRVTEDAVAKKRDLGFWIGAALEFDGRAASSPNRK
jgi:hypothetical protein